MLEGLGELGGLEGLKAEKGVQNSVMGSLGGVLRSFLGICRAWKMLMWVLGVSWRFVGFSEGALEHLLLVFGKTLGAFGGIWGILWLSFGAILVIWGTKIVRLLSQDDAKGMFKLEISVLAKTLKKQWFFNDLVNSEVSKTIKIIEKIIIFNKI